MQLPPIHLRNKTLTRPGNPGMKVHGCLLKSLNLGVASCNTENLLNDLNNWLVASTPLKNMKVSWDDSSQYMEK